MTSEAIAYIKKNISTLVDYYKNGVTPESWLSDKIGKKAFVEIDQLEFDDFELQINEETPSSDDVTNSKLLYSKLKNLNDSFATDERLWAGLSHTVFFNYMQKRWPNKNDEASILNHYFFKGGKPRCYMVNTISRLWWICKKTYINDPDIDDPYQILDYISHDINGYSFTLFGSNWSNSERSLLLFFKAIFKYEKETNEKVDRGLFNDAMQYMNCLCGLYIIDACDDSFIVDSIFNYLEKRQKELLQIAQTNKANNIKQTGIERLDNLIKALNLLGGRGNLQEIYIAYQRIIKQPLSASDKNYIKTNLEKNSPDSPSYKGKPIFYKIYRESSMIWKIAVEFLTKANRQEYNKFITEQRNKVIGIDKNILNVLSTLKAEKVSISSIAQFKTQLLDIYPEITNFDVQLRQSIKNLQRLGLIEYIGDSTYKKTYSCFKEL